MQVVAPITIATGSTLVSTNVDTTGDPAAYNAGTTYAAAARVTAGEVIYESLQAANIGHDPTLAASATWWANVGAINKMAMFDKRVTTLTVFADHITVVISPGDIVSSLGLRGLEGESVTVTQTDPTDGVVYTQTQSIADDVLDWFDYLYGTAEVTPDAVFVGLAAYASATITVTISAPGGTAKCGLLVLGYGFEAGDAESGATDGITDYSVVRTDQWGNRDTTERDYADDAEFTVWVDAAVSPRFRRLLASRRAKETLIILDETRPDAQYYGLLSFRRTFAFDGQDVYAITVKGST